MQMEHVVAVRRGALEEWLRRFLVAQGVGKNKNSVRVVVVVLLLEQKKKKKKQHRRCHQDLLLWVWEFEWGCTDHGEVPVDVVCCCLLLFAVV